MTQPPSSPPSKIRTLEVKRDPWVAIPFLLIVAAVITATAMHKLDPAVAALILGALGFPSMVGIRTMPQLVTALVAELQLRIASLPPPPALPTGTEPQPGLSTPPPAPPPLPMLTTPITKDEDR